jgi:hypothetical protein
MYVNKAQEKESPRKPTRSLFYVSLDGPFRNRQHPTERSVTVWNRFVWLRIGTSRGLF